MSNKTLQAIEEVKIAMKTIMDNIPKIDYETPKEVQLAIEEVYNTIEKHRLFLEQNLPQLF